MNAYSRRPTPIDPQRRMHIRAYAALIQHIDLTLETLPERQAAKTALLDGLIICGLAQASVSEHMARLSMLTVTARIAPPANPRDAADALLEAWRCEAMDALAMTAPLPKI